MDCWNTTSMITGTSTITRDRYFFTALAWRCTPVGGPLGVRGAHPPPVGPRRPRELPPHVPIDTREKPDKVRHDRRHFHQLVLHLRHRSESRGRRRHFHQLFRQLRLLERGTLQDRVLKNLGHFDDLLHVRQRLVEDLHTTESTVCVPGTWSSWTTGTISTICSTMRRGTCSCGPDTAGSRSGRVPLTAGGSSSSREKCCTPAVWGVGSTGAWPCTSSLTHHPLLASLCPRWAVWRSLSARSIATVIRSCRSQERSSRCRRLIAAPAACSSLPRNDHIESITEKKVTQKPGQRLSV